MLKEKLGICWLTPKYVLTGWDIFFKEEIFTIAILHAIVIFLSYFVNIFCLLSQWQVSIIIIIGRRIMAGGLCISKKRLDGKTVIITGSNTGIGKETARDLARRGARIIMACRDLNKATAAADEIITETGSEIIIMKLDLASLDSIRLFVKEFKSKYDQLDILINNAGIMMCPFGLGECGLELQFSVNHIGHFLLTNLLLPLLKDADEARIINVSSLAHHFASLHLDDLTYKKGYDANLAYGNSKLANVLFTISLAEHLKDTNVKVFAVHPGTVQSEIIRFLSISKIKSVIDVILSLFFKKTMEGAQTSIYCAVEAESHPYCYYADCEVGNSSSVARDMDVARKLWKISEEIVGSFDNETTKNK